MPDKEISLYIHIPFCLSKCDYCDFFSIPCMKIPDDYIESLCNEISFRFFEIKRLNPKIKLSSIYIGGGTPSLLSENQFMKLFRHIEASVDFSQKMEFTVEVNPDDVSEKLLLFLSGTDVNRISCGIQSMNDSSLKCVNRRADKNHNERALNLFEKFWKKTLSLDMIAGLPFETEESFLEGLGRVVSANPHHVSLYTLTVEEGTELFRKIENGAVDYDFDFSDKLWLLGKDFLKKNGYEHYEVSNFSKKDFYCKHNLAYWQRKSYAGCGSGGTGTIYDGKTAFRWTNVCDVKKYISCWKKIDFSELDKEFSGNFTAHEFLKMHENHEDCGIELFRCKKLKMDGYQAEEIIEGIDCEFEYFMMGLRTKWGVNSCDYEKYFSKEINPKFVKLMENWQEKNLAEIRRSTNSDGKENVNFSLNSNGILFLNRFLEELDLE